MQRLFLFLAVLLTNAVWSQSLTLTVPFIPQPVNINGKPTVFYELHLVNKGDSGRVKSLKIIDDQSLVLFELNESDWKKRTSSIGSKIVKDNFIAPQDSLVVYLEFTLPEKSKRIIHQLSVDVNGISTSVRSEWVHVLRDSPVVLGAPLKGGPWTAVYSAEWERGHRRVIYTMSGKARIPGRYAIDFILMNEEGHYANGDENEIKNWLGYEADVLAVKDGTVLSVLNDFPESATLSAHPDYPPSKATGNYISIDIGNNQIVFYEHLKPGSIRVKPGQKIKKGEVIASLGFTGQTTGPHLHFHVANANSPLGAEGIPYAFEQFKLLGEYNQFEDFGKKRWTPANEKNIIIKGERPGPNKVLQF